MRKNAGFIGIFACIAVGAVLLPGCSDETPKRQATSEKAQSDTPVHVTEWLDLKADISPAQWLASQGEEKVLPVSDERVERIDRDLDRAHAIFRESKRMIANRSAQLERMLNALGAKETAAELLADILSIPGEVGQTEGFGAVTQHYYILRSGQTERGPALAILKDRYGQRSPEAGAVR